MGPEHYPEGWADVPVPFTHLLMLAWQPVHDFVIDYLCEAAPDLAALLPFPNICAWRAACPTCSGAPMNQHQPSPKYLALKQAFNDLVEEATSDSPGRLRRMSKLLKIGQDLDRTYGRDAVDTFVKDGDDEEDGEDGVGIYRPRIAGRYGGDTADLQRQMMMLAQRALEAWVAKQTGAPLGPALGPEDFAKVLNAAATADRDNPPGPAPEHDAADAAAE